MALDNDYLNYPLRRYGYDHDRYDWSMLDERAPVTWPGGKRLAVWINVSLQFYPLDQRGVPFKVPNGMTMPYPDLRHFSLRDYGNRVGIYRVLKALEKYGITPTYAINAQLAEQTPYLVKRLQEHGGEFIAHGWNMDHLHYGGQPIEEEAELVARSVDTLRRVTGQTIRGWLSPAKHQSFNTPDLLVKNGIEYCADWVNDELPYAFKTASGALTMMGLSTEIEDQFVMSQNLHSEDAWVAQVKDAFDFLLEESRTAGGRLFALNLHPWLVGQPHRIACLEEVLAHIARHEEVWQAPAGEILDAFKAARASDDKGTR
ncbi:polysaccharide deacetylase family protein [Vreelandella malpeensis]|uniref:Polysaccharide deacetylase family protein n=1 Tax=Vreelandella malpeensis TaxID=1172368 RepID=A0ABS8DS37_9GAMM|nr:polysaccharide deacetylase family protein [Halomonas malpeensis]MCB8889054.1 polysaccharide deacetylase family protein [Halomonas malpeensis]